MAKTTDVIIGTYVGIFIDDVLVGCGTNAQITITNEEVETTCKDNDGAETKAPGKQTWSMTFDGNVKYENALGARAAMELVKTRDQATFKIATSNNTEDPYWTGEGFISTFTQSNPNNAPSTYNFAVSPKGPIYLFNT